MNCPRWPTCCCPDGTMRPDCPGLAYAVTLTDPNPEPPERREPLWLRIIMTPIAWLCGLYIVLLMVLGLIMGK